MSWGVPPFPVQPTFDCPLLCSTTPRYAAGAATPTFAVVTSAGNAGSTVIDWEGRLRHCKPGEARFSGARRVENMLGHNNDSRFLSENMSNWEKYNGGTASVLPVITANYAQNPFSTGATASRIQLNMGTDAAAGYSEVNTSCTFLSTDGTYAAGNKYMRGSVWLKSLSGSPYVCLRMYNDGGSLPNFGSFTLQIDGTWRRYCTPVATTFWSATICRFEIGSFGSNHHMGSWACTTGAVDILAWGAQLENVSGQSNQNPGEYVSVGVLGGAYHGAHVDGVRYFDKLNANTVAGSMNIVNDVAGWQDILPRNGASKLAVDDDGPLGFLAEATQAVINQTPFVCESAFNTWSYKSACTVSDLVVTGPTGEVKGSGIYDDTSTGYHYAAHGAALTLGRSDLALCQSCFFAPGLYNTVSLRFGDNVAQNCDCWYSLTGAGSVLTPAGGNVGGGAIFRSAGIERFAGGWYRCWQIVTFAGTINSMTVGFIPNVTAGSYAGNTSSPALYMYGMCVQSGLMTWDKPPSYTPIVGGVGSRGLDKLTYAQSGNMNQSQGTVYAEARAMWQSDKVAVPPSRVVVGAGASTYSLLQTGGATGGTTQITMATSTHQTATKSGLLDMFTGVRKVAGTWGRSSGTKIAVTGSGLAPFISNTTSSMASNGIGIGVEGAVSPSVNFNGNVRYVKIWSAIATDPELAWLTAPPAAQMLREEIEERRDVLKTELVLEELKSRVSVITPTAEEKDD